MGKWAKYSKRYKKAWENEANLKEWIVEVDGDNSKAACRFCHSMLRAHHSDLMSHAATVKHKRNAGQGGIVVKEKVRYKKAPRGGDKKCVKQVTLTASFVGTKDRMEDPEPLFQTKICPDEVVNPASLGFIGSGNIAQALLTTFLKDGLVDPNLTIASAPSDNNLSKLRELGVRTTHDNNEVVRSSDLVFVCVKPDILTEVLGHLLPLEDDHSPLFVSVVAGVSIVTLEEMLSNVVVNPRVVRSMPNTPSAVGQGCCLFTRGTHTSPSDADVMRSMLGSMGMCDEIQEHHMDAACGLACSAPAFIFMATEALADGGVKMGLPRQLAQTLAAQTVKGAAAMVLETGKHPGELKDEVCSASEATIAALHILERNAFRNALMTAVEASATKGTRLNGNV